MESLNNIPQTGNFGDIATKLNDNFNKLNIAVETVQSDYISNKGYFASLASLQTSYPSPEAGDTAYVADALSSTGYYIYNVANGVWTASTVEAPPVSVPINDYALHGYESSPKTLKEVDDSVEKLATEINPTFEFINNNKVKNVIKKISIHKTDGVPERLYVQYVKKEAAGNRVYLYKVLDNTPLLNVIVGTSNYFSYHLSDGSFIEMWFDWSGMTEGETFVFTSEDNELSYSIFSKKLSQFEINPILFFDEFIATNSDANIQLKKLQKALKNITITRTNDQTDDLRVYIIKRGITDEIDWKFTLWNKTKNVSWGDYASTKEESVFRYIANGGEIVDVSIDWSVLEGGESIILNHNAGAINTISLSRYKIKEPFDYTRNIVFDTIDNKVNGIDKLLNFITDIQLYGVNLSEKFRVYLIRKSDTQDSVVYIQNINDSITYQYRESDINKIKSFLVFYPNGGGRIELTVNWDALNIGESYPYSESSNIISTHCYRIGIEPDTLFPALLFDVFINTDATRILRKFVKNIRLIGVPTTKRYYFSSIRPGSETEGAAIYIYSTDGYLSRYIAPIGEQPSLISIACSEGGTIELNVDWTAVSATTGPAGLNAETNIISTRCYSNDYISSNEVTLSDSELKVLKTGDDLFVRQKFSEDKDIVTRYRWTWPTSCYQNFLIPDETRMIDNTSADGVSLYSMGDLYHYMQDSNSPILTNQYSYIGGLHGLQIAQVTSTNHSKTVADIGSKWIGNGKIYVLVEIPDANTLRFFNPPTVNGDGLGKDSYDYLMNGVSTLLHYSGATNIGDISVNSVTEYSLKPTMIAPNPTKIIINGKILEDDEVVVCNSFKAIDNYYIINPADINVEQGNPDFMDMTKAGYLAEMVITFEFNPMSVSIYHTFRVIDYINLNYYGFWQPLGLRNSESFVGMPPNLGVKVYCPEVPDASVQPYFSRDWGREVDVTYPSSSTPDKIPTDILQPAKWEYGNISFHNSYLSEKGINRFIWYLFNRGLIHEDVEIPYYDIVSKELGFVSGFDNSVGAGDPAIHKELSSSYGYFASGERRKMYWNMINNRVLNPDDTIDAIFYYSYFNPKLNPDCQGVYWFKSGGKWIVFIDMLKSVDMLFVNLPSFLYGYKINILEKTDNITLHSSVISGGLFIKTSDSNPSNIKIELV